MQLEAAPFEMCLKPGEALSMSPCAIQETTFAYGIVKELPRNSQVAWDTKTRGFPNDLTEW